MDVLLCTRCKEQGHKTALCPYEHEPAPLNTSNPDNEQPMDVDLCQSPLQDKSTQANKRRASLLSASTSVKDDKDENSTRNLQQEKVLITKDPPNDKIEPEKKKPKKKKPKQNAGKKELPIDDHTTLSSDSDMDLESKCTPLKQSTKAIYAPLDLFAATHKKSYPISITNLSLLIEMYTGSETAVDLAKEFTPDLNGLLTMLTELHPVLEDRSTKIVFTKFKNAIIEHFDSLNLNPIAENSSKHTS
jgi:hypothetical protein